MYKPEDCFVILTQTDSQGNEKSFKIDSFVEPAFSTPERYHWATKGDNGLWELRVKHKGNRIAKFKLTEESYQKYGIEKLDPFIDNFNLDYNDEDLVQVK